MDEQIVRRITFVRLLLQQANTLFEKTNETMAGMPLLPAHDAVEMLLRAVAEVSDASVPNNAAFDQLIAKIDEKLAGQTPPKVIPYRTAINRLNTARNNFKHAGIMPTLKEANEFLLHARRFCEQVSLDYFSRSLESFRSVIWSSVTALEHPLKRQKLS